jgi:hypothetical protein
MLCGLLRRLDISQGLAVTLYQIIRYHYRQYPCYPILEISKVLAVTDNNCHFMTYNSTVTSPTGRTHSVTPLLSMVTGRRPAGIGYYPPITLITAL